MNVEIRKAKEKDYKTVFSLDEKFVLYHSRFKVWKLFEPSDKVRKVWKKLFMGFIKKRNKLALIAEEDNKIIGFLLGKINKRRGFKIEKTAHIEKIFVDENYRNKGVATKLKNEFIKWAKKKGAKALTLYVAVENKKALKLYKSWNLKKYCYGMYKLLK